MLPVFRYFSQFATVHEVPVMADAKRPPPLTALELQELHRTVKSTIGRRSLWEIHRLRGIVLRAQELEILVRDDRFLSRDAQLIKVANALRANLDKSRSSRRIGRSSTGSTGSISASTASILAPTPCDGVNPGRTPTAVQVPCVPTALRSPVRCRTLPQAIDPRFRRLPKPLAASFRGCRRRHSVSSYQRYRTGSLLAQGHAHHAPRMLLTI